MARYEYRPYPKAVYTPEGKSLIINSADEWPEGYVSFEDWKAGTTPAADPAQDALDASQKVAEKAERDALRAYLDENNVEYAKNLGLPRLRMLADKLTTYLANQVNEDDDSA